MRLEPKRDNLSGDLRLSTSFAESSAARVSTGAAPVVARKCSVCSAEDIVHTMHGQYDERGDPLVEHSVTIELRYLEKPADCTPYLQARGWSFLTWQARPAMQRFVCTPCLEGQRLMQREFSRKKSTELRSSTSHSNYYSALCEE